MIIQRIYTTAALLTIWLTLSAQVTTTAEANPAATSSQAATPGHAATYTLEQCIASARQHNRELQNAALDIDAAREQKAEAWTKYFPQVSANVMAFYAFDKLIKSDGTYPQELAALSAMAPSMGESGAMLAALGQMAGQPYSISELNRGYSATLSAMQPIYAGGQITTGNKLAALQQEVREMQLRLTEKDIVQKVTENFWQIAQLKYNLRTLDAADRQLSAVYKQVENYVKAGVTTRNDLLKVTMRQQELKSNRLKVNNGIRVLMLLLAQETGMQQPFDILLPDEAQPAAPPTKATAADACSTADATARIEYALALKNIEAQQLQLKMERAKLMPTIAVGVMGYHTGFGGLSESAKQYASTTMTNGIALATLSIPISDWWGGTHAIRRQKIAVQQARNNADDAREQLAIDNASAWLNLQEAYEQIGVQKVSVEQAEENLRLATEQHRAGTETITDLLDAETLNRQAKDNLASAIATYHIRLADYHRKCDVR